MPRYEFECEGCQSHFEIVCSMNEIEGLKPKCPTCKKNKKVFRDFSGSHVSVPKTLGSLADKNTSKMSSDQKEYLTNKYDHRKNFSDS